VLPVLIEKPGRREGQMSGRSPYLQPVHLEAGGALVGQIVFVRIVQAHRGSLTGDLSGAQLGDDKAFT
jgi:tRNA-2-methylthio-N6-dimethylallyladenosine synthase